jgi:hypothetical protein
MEVVKFRLVNKYIEKVYPEFLVDNCFVEHNAHGVSLYSGGELIGSVGIYGGHISFYGFESSIVENVDSVFGNGVFDEWFKITYYDKIYNVNVVVPPF